MGRWREELGVKKRPQSAPKVALKRRPERAKAPPGVRIATPHRQESGIGGWK